MLNEVEERLRFPKERIASHFDGFMRRSSLQQNFTRVHGTLQSAVGKCVVPQGGDES